MAPQGGRGMCAGPEATSAAKVPSLAAQQRMLRTALGKAAPPPGGIPRGLFKIIANAISLIFCFLSSQMECYIRTYLVMETFQKSKKDQVLLALL